MPNSPVVLIGPMGVGKTTIGRKLAKSLKVDFIDTDSLIVREHGPDGQLVSVERRVRIHRTEIQKPKAVADRRRWAKFGAAAGAPPGPEAGITIIR